MQLACRGCGGINAASQSSHADGWYRCGFCGTPNAVSPTDADLFEGPASRIVVVRRLGRYQLTIPRETLMLRGEFLAAMFVLISLAAAATAIFEINQDLPTLVRRGLPIAIVVAAVGLARKLWNRLRAEQVLELSPKRIRYCRRLAGKDRGVAELAIRQHLLVSDAQEADQGKRRNHVDVSVGPKSLARLTCLGAREAAWLRAIVRAATDDAPDETTLACPGCSAPIARTLADTGRGFLNCPFCDAGLTFADNVLQLPAAELPDLDDPVSATPPDPIRPVQHPSRVEWLLRPAGWMTRAVFMVSLLYGVALFAALGGFMLFAITLTPPGTIALKLYLVTGGLLMLGLASGVVYIMVRLAVGGQRFWFEHHVLAVDDMLDMSFLGKGVVPSPPLISSVAGTFSEDLDGDHEPQLPANKLANTVRHAYRREQYIRVPLFLLTKLAFTRNGATETTEMSLVTARRRYSVKWTLPDGADMWLRCSIVAQVRTSLIELGRKVVRNQ